jgi:ribosome biogenesis SPOUT family RNA methylase Rps3
MRWWTVAVAAGCSSFPDVVLVEALVDGEAVDELDPHAVDELVFADDLPPGTTFRVTFDETMSLPTAREAMWVEDADGVALAVAVDARLQEIEVAPVDPLEVDQNHTLVVESSVQDNNGNAMLSGYRVAFYVAE